MSRTALRSSRGTTASRRARRRCRADSRTIARSRARAVRDDRERRGARSGGFRALQVGGPEVTGIQDAVQARGDFVMSGLTAIHIRPGHPDFLDLPWNVPLVEWPAHCGRLVEVQRGLSRHEVVFVGYDAGVYALKELPEPFAEREYDALRELEERKLPAVAAVGHARAVNRLEEPTSVLVTRYLEFSLPYRTLFMQPGLARYRERLLDAMASLLVRLHVAGIFWGDCSLSNTLFRRDAGELQAYLVDAETAEIHEELSKGQRAHDLDIMEENVSGDIADLSAWIELPSGAPFGDIATSIRERYDRLWAEVTREEILAPSESYRIHERIRALNDLGFSVGEIELVATGLGDQLRMRAMVTDRDHHRHQLHSLTGLVAEERQATQILNDVRELRATLSRELKRSVPLSVAAMRWRDQRFDNVVRRLGALVGVSADVVELYCQVLEHKWYLSEQARQDVGLDRALDDFVTRLRSLAPSAGLSSAAGSPIDARLLPPGVEPPAVGVRPGEPGSS